VVEDLANALEHISIELDGNYCRDTARAALASAAARLGGVK